MEKQSEIVLDNLEQIQIKTQQKLTNEEIKNLLSEQTNVLSKKEIDEFFKNLKGIISNN